MPVIMKYIIQACKLDVFFEMEEKMITKSSMVSDMMFIITVKYLPTGQVSD